MSNPGDRCALTNCRGLRAFHDHTFHAFVEPAPQAESANVRDCQCRKLHEGPCSPGPDAAVRALIEESRVPLGTRGWQLVREAFAAGRALGRDEGEWEEREACEKLARGMAKKTFGDAKDAATALADAIARRGTKT